MVVALRMTALARRGVSTSRLAPVVTSSTSNRGYSDKNLSVKYRVTIDPTDRDDTGRGGAGRGGAGAGMAGAGTASNGVGFQATDPAAALATITVGLKGGSRSEGPETMGLAHYFRVCTGLGTKSNTHFGFTRNLNQAGASFTTTGDREATYLTLQCLKDDVDKLLPFLKANTCCQLFRHWEVEDRYPFLVEEVRLFQSDPKYMVMDLIHEAAFHTGLGRSICAPQFAAGQLNDKHLKEFLSKTLNGESVTVSSTGLDADKLKSFAESLEIKGGGSHNWTPSKFHGGDARRPFPGNMTYVAIAGQGPALSNAKEVAAAHVWKHAMGSDPHLKWGVSSTSVLGKTLSSSGDSGTTGAAAFSHSYSDAGLAGVICAAENKNIEDVATAVGKLLKSGGKLSGEDVSRGKAGASVALSSMLESSKARTEALAENHLNGGGAQNLEAIIDGIESVSAGDVNKVASGVSKGLAVAVVGAIYDVPCPAEY